MQTNVKHSFQIILMYILCAMNNKMICYLLGILFNKFIIINCFFLFQIDDQICLLINSWCELLLFSCCFRSMSTPGEIRISLGKSITLSQAKDMGMQACIERMLNFTEQLRRLRVDQYEYVAMKVIVLLTSGKNQVSFGMFLQKKVRSFCLNTFKVRFFGRNLNRFKIFIF